MGQIQAKDLIGSMVALVTPMHGDGSINFIQWQALLEWHVKCGTDAVVVAGTTGESVLLSTTEIAALIKSAVNICQHANTKVIVGTGAINPDKVIQANQQAAELAADAVLIATPYYLTLTQNALLEHFNGIAAQSKLPIILYNVPNRTGMDLQASTTAKLAHTPNIIGIKEAKADMDRIKQLVKIKNFTVLSGDDGSFVEAMSLGAHGVISVAANARPQAIKRICNHIQLGNMTEAEQLNENLTPLYDFLFHEPNPCPVKAILHAAEVIDDGIRKPLILTGLKSTHINQHVKHIRQEFNPL
ncbi:4-hydroxy-tetrahydrodipicolinate synthase [hydrothermal vent metagenome]|uniref:4-hydroxy-tetrahydrodipicolinate synthase n=1 Tax=hydrothermal vent metagenome TaxID=652676 RepID=A0A3B0VJX8_9ZZZZ